MIKRIKNVALLCACVALLFAACKSAPKAEPKTAPVETPKQEEKTEEKVEVPAVVANDYSQSNADLLAKVAAARDAAIAAGAEAANPDGYKAAEVEYDAEKAAAGDSTADLTVPMNDLIARYNALASFANAKAKKDRIDSLNFASYDQSDYDAASALLDELSAPTANIAKGKDLYDKAGSAENKFDAVLNAGFKAQAKDARTAAFKAKQQADSVKAAVSRKAEYDQGVESFRSGDQNYVTKNPEGAVEQYVAAKDMFTKLYTEISDARAQALAAIEAAKKRVSDSNAVASKADADAPLGDTKVQGIEDPDAKLLEDDDFSSADSAAVSVDETLSEGVPEK